MRYLHEHEIVHRDIKSRNSIYTIDTMYTSNKKHFRKNVKECRDVIVQKVYKQGRDGSVTHHIFDLIAPYIVVTYIHCNGVCIVMFAIILYL